MGLVVQSGRGQGQSYSIKKKRPNESRDRLNLVKNSIEPEGVLHWQMHIQPGSTSRVIFALAHRYSMYILLCSAVCGRQSVYRGGMMILMTIWSVGQPLENRRYHRGLVYVLTSPHRDCSPSALLYTSRLSFLSLFFFFSFSFSFSFTLPSGLRFHNFFLFRLSSLPRFFQPFCPAMTFFISRRKRNNEPQTQRQQQQLTLPGCAPRNENKCRRKKKRKRKKTFIYLITIRRFFFSFPILVKNDMLQQAWVNMAFSVCQLRTLYILRLVQTIQVLIYVQNIIRIGCVHYLALDFLTFE